MSETAAGGQAPRWPAPKRGQLADIPGPLFDSWQMARRRLAAWQDAADDMETQIRELIGAATVICVDRKPVARRRVTRHENVSWTSDDIVKWPQRKGESGGH